MSRLALADPVAAGKHPQDAVAVHDDSFMSRGISNSDLVATGGGALLVNTASAHEADAIHERFTRACGEPVQAIVLTQSHPDHMRLDDVQWIHDETVAGMNAGSDLFTLQRELQLPPELALEEALHLTDIVLGAVPDHRGARTVALAAHELPLERSGKRTSAKHDG
jgi:glyoxylase-like metal-dependent hydrolase (beta-lactamase superfamily II)